MDNHQPRRLHETKHGVGNGTDYRPRTEHCGDAGLPTSTSVFGGTWMFAGVLHVGDGGNSGELVVDEKGEWEERCEHGGGGEGRG